MRKKDDEPANLGPLYVTIITIHDLQTIFLVSCDLTRLLPRWPASCIALLHGSHRLGVVIVAIAVESGTLVLGTAWPTWYSTRQDGMDYVRYFFRHLLLM